MLSIGYETIVLLLLLMGAVCAMGGYAFAQSRQRRAGGGKTSDELKVELDTYKENVTEHFQTTAGLLHDMTEQYRSVYEHMADGAQKLCDADSATPQIAGLRAGLLPAAAAADVVSEPLSTEVAAEEMIADAAPDAVPNQAPSEEATTENDVAEQSDEAPANEFAGTGDDGHATETGESGLGEPDGDPQPATEKG